MNLKKIGKALIFPHTAIVLLLIPAAAAALVYSMAVIGSESMAAYLSYALSAYTLTVVCARIPAFLRFCKTIPEKNKLINRWLEDSSFRINVSLYGTLLWNTAYALFQLGLGIYHKTFWYYSMAGYYFSLALMRFLLVRHTRKYRPGEKPREELIRYRICGFVFLIMNLTLSVMIFFMVYWNRTFHHHEITTIAMAAYTFGAFTMAVINLIKYRKFKSPVYSASKAISLAAACVSMLTLESTMLTTFQDASMPLTARRMMLGISGGAISVFIISMAVYMIVHSSKQLKEYPHGA